MRRRQSGHALFVAMIIMVLVASAIALLATHYGVRARLGSQEARRIHLVALTDAAVAESLAHLSETSGFAEGVRWRHSRQRDRVPAFRSSRNRGHLQLPWLDPPGSRPGQAAPGIDRSGILVGPTPWRTVTLAPTDALI